MIKLIAGLALLPSALGSILAAGRAMGDVTAAARDTLPFLLGFFGYPLLHILSFQSIRLYVFGHELTHALAAWMSGAGVLKFAVGHKGGHVDLTHSSAMIALAPYVFPIYSVLVLLIYRIVLWLAPLSAAGAHRAYWVFLAAIGASLSFHLVQTIQSLWDVRQPDLDQAGGVVFSVAVIGFLNGVFLILGLKCLFPHTVAAGQSLRIVWRLSAHFWKAVFFSAESAAQYWLHRRASPGPGAS